MDNPTQARLATGQRGDWATVGDGIYELRIHCGPGYQVYFAEQSDTYVVLLAGGDKSSQRRDIVKARTLHTEWKEVMGDEEAS